MKKIKKMFKYLVYKLLFPHVKVLSKTETIGEVLKGKSVARFGDGEFGIMMSNSSIGFQKSTKRLARDLREVFFSEAPNLLVCVPDTFTFNVSKYSRRAQRFWMSSLSINWNSWRRIVNFERSYGDTQFSRPYLDAKDKTTVKPVFDEMKQIWLNRDVLIVEGTQTNFGLGNDLLNNAAAVNRIIAPPEGAYEVIDDIEQLVTKNYQQDSLVLLALGPTATILAQRLCLKGIQAIDIGHADIEYEWYQRKAVDRIAIPGKYVNEAGGSSEEKLPDKLMSEKNSQIVAYVD